MRTICSAAALAACLAVPAVTRAQSAHGAVLATYALSGCADGAVSATADGGLVFGHPFCVRGDVALVDAGLMDGGLRRIDARGTAAALFNPAFTGTAAGEDTRGELTLEFRSAACPAGCPRYGTLPYLGWTVGGAAPSFASSFVIDADADLRTVTLTEAHAGAVNLYGIAGFPGYQFGSVPQAALVYTLTATPEPAPLALTAVALGGVVAFGVRRRRA